MDGSLDASGVTPKDHPNGAATRAHARGLAPSLARPAARDLRQASSRRPAFSPAGRGNSADIQPDNVQIDSLTLRWGLLAAEAKRKGRALSAIYGLLAATALHHNLTIVSRNVSDFAATQVPILNPWEAP